MFAFLNTNLLKKMTPAQTQPASGKGSDESWATTVALALALTERMSRRLGELVGTPETNFSVSFLLGCVNFGGK